MNLTGSAPRTNRVAQLNAFGTGNVAIVERPLLDIKPGEVRIRVRAASLNHRDLLASSPLTPGYPWFRCPIAPAR